MDAKRKDSSEWFSGNVFNLIIDYYTEISGRPYGTGLDEDEFAELLRELRPGFVTVYAKGHSGRTVFPSVLKTEHRMVKKNLLELYRRACDKAGVKLFLYYSGMVDGTAAILHEDWRIRSRDGTPKGSIGKENYMMFPVCPLSGYFDLHVSVHFKEMFELCSPDGIWVDGDWDWLGPCYCERCEKRFRRETGYGGPMPDLNDNESDAGQKWQRQWLTVSTEWRDRFAALVKSLKPDCLYSAGNVNPRMEYSYQCDWKSGDWFSPNNHRLMQSIAMRRYSTQNVPYDAMTCDTSFVHSKEWLRSRSKPLGRMLQEGATVFANGGVWSYWTYPMPDGAMVPSKMRRAKAASDFVRERGDAVANTRGLGWTAVLDCDKKSFMSSTEKAGWGACKALIALHRSPEILDETELGDGTPYKLIVLPEQPQIPDETVDILEAFVRNGGTLLSSGASILSDKLQKLLGVKLARIGALSDGHVFLSDGEPAGVFAKWDALDVAGAGELYPLYRSWDDTNIDVRSIGDNYPITGLVDERNPEYAGFPGVTSNRVGSGAAVHIPVDIFGQYWKLGDPQMLSLLREIIAKADPDPLFTTDALSFVEVSLRKKDGDTLINFTNGNPGRDMSYVFNHDLWVDDIPPVGPIRFTLKCEKKPRGVALVPLNAPLPFEWDGERILCEVPKLEIHCCAVVRH